MRGESNSAALTLHLQGCGVGTFNPKAGGSCEPCGDTEFTDKPRQTVCQRTTASHVLAMTFPAECNKGFVSSQHRDHCRIKCPQGASHNALDQCVCSDRRKVLHDNQCGEGLRDLVHVDACASVCCWQ